MGEALKNPFVIVLLTLAGFFVLRLLVVLVATGGDLGRDRLAFRAARRIWRDAAFADKVRELLQPPPPKDAGPPKPSGVPLRLLALLQREGRLLDFLLED